MHHVITVPTWHIAVVVIMLLVTMWALCIIVHSRNRIVYERESEQIERELRKLGA